MKQALQVKLAALLAVALLPLGSAAHPIDSCAWGDSGGRLGSYDEATEVDSGEACTGSLSPYGHDDFGDRYYWDATPAVASLHVKLGLNFCNDGSKTLKLSIWLYHRTGTLDQDSWAYSPTDSWIALVTPGTCPPLSFEADGHPHLPLVDFGEARWHARVWLNDYATVPYRFTGTVSFDNNP